MRRSRRLIEAFVIRFAHAEPFRERAENVEIVARLSVRLDRALHREEERIARRAADVVALERVVAGSTMSAWRAVAVHQGSCTTIVSGFANASRKRKRS